MEAFSREVVVDFLRGVYGRAVRDESGVAYYLSAEQMAVLEDGDIQKIEDETGYSSRRRRAQLTSQARTPFRADMQ
jgi:hypothetical protein